MAPRKKKPTDTDTTPPDSPGAKYDRVVFICLRDQEPVLSMPIDHVYGDGQTLQDVANFDGSKRLTIQQRVKVHNFIFDETKPQKGMSIFCRVQTGVDQSRVDSLVKDLNSRFKSLSYPQKSALKALMINSWGEKMMKDWTYDEKNPITNKITYKPWNSVGTRGRGTEELPVTTGAEDSDEDFQTSNAKKGSKAILSSSSEGGRTPRNESDVHSGSFLQNPFFTPGTSKDSPSTGKLHDPQPSTSKGLGKKTGKIASPAAATVIDLTKESAKDSRKRKAASAKSKKVVEETSESDSTLTPSPSKRPTLDLMAQGIYSQQELAPKDAVPSQVAGASGVVRAQSGSTGSQGQAQGNVQGVDQVMYDIAIPRMDVPTYTEAIVISEEQLDNKLRAFLTDYHSMEVQAESFKIVIKAAVKEAIDEKLDNLKVFIKATFAEEIQKVMEAMSTKATKASTGKILDELRAIKVTIEDFSIEQARIRGQISNMTEHQAEKESRSCGILGRFLPFDLMGQGFDLFCSSHYVQSKIVSLIKDELLTNPKKLPVDVQIAFAFTNGLLTRLAMAHLVWRQPKNSKKVLYYKRKIPDATEKIITKDIIPFVRANLELGGEKRIGSFAGVKKVMTNRFNNARTKQLELAFEGNINPDLGLDALHSIDNEFYVHNVHAIPESEMEDRLVYKRKLYDSRGECKNAFDNYKPGEKSKTVSKDELEFLFDSMRGPNSSRKVYTNYEIMQGIVAAAKADGLDVRKMTFDQPSNMPDVRVIYKKVLDDNIADMDALLRKFPVDTNIKRERSDSENEEELQLRDISLASNSGGSDEGDDEDDGNVGQDEQARAVGDDEFGDVEEILEEETESPSEFDRNIEQVPPTEEHEASQTPEDERIPVELNWKPTGNREEIRKQAKKIRAAIECGIPAKIAAEAVMGIQPERPPSPEKRTIPPPLPPLPENPYALPNPYAHMTNEELEARIKEIQRRTILQKELREAEEAARRQSQE